VHIRTTLLKFFKCHRRICSTSNSAELQEPHLSVIFWSIQIFFTILKLSTSETLNLPLQHATDKESLRNQSRQLYTGLHTMAKFSSYSLNIQKLPFPAEPKHYIFPLVRSKLTYCSQVWHPYLLKGIYSYSLTAGDFLKRVSNSMQYWVSKQGSRGAAPNCWEILNAFLNSTDCYIDVIIIMYTCKRY